MTTDTATAPDCLQDPMSRSPLEFDIGLYIADGPAEGGAQGFCWFAREEDAVAYLRDELPAMFGDDPEELTPVRLAMEQALCCVGGFKAVSLEAVNAAAQGLFELRWAGTFDELRYGKDAFAREIQRDFHENTFGDERGQAPDGTETEDFACHLQNYCG